MWMGSRNGDISVLTKCGHGHFGTSIHPSSPLPEYHKRAEPVTTQSHIVGSTT